ncbi:MAG: TPM domain-containing protein [Bacteroidia bacterium]|nr:TPM domain-containing protein [Bacteroidia bacterium]
MKFPLVKAFSLILVLCMAQPAAQAQSSPALPKPTGFVTDTRGLLTPAQRSTLDAFLTQFAQNTSNEIAVAILDLPEDEVLEEYTNTLARSWGVGGQEDNGVLLVVFPAARRMRIEVGYGLEGAIPDAAAFLIIENTLKPAFRQEAYYAGIDSAVHILASLAQGEYNISTLRDYYQAPAPPEDNTAGFVLIVLIIVFVVFLNIYNRPGGGGSGKGRRNGRGYTRSGPYDSGPYVGGWWVGGGGWGSSSDSGSSWGGGSDSGSSWGGGGDFGGFSGGDFGGGGSSGDW